MIRRFGKAVLVIAMMLAAPLLVACGSDETPPAPAPGSVNAALAGAPSAAANTSDSRPTACTDQQVRECRVELGQQGTVQNCFVGLQLCSKGVWGPCSNASDIEAQLNK